MKLMRSVGAIVGGYLVFALSAVALFQVTNHNPHAAQSIAFILGATLYGMLFAFLGGYLAARLAPTRPSMHATIVAVIIGLGSAVSLLTSPAAATWSQWAALVLMAPCAVLGGRRRLPQ